MFDVRTNNEGATILLINMGFCVYEVTYLMMYVELVFIEDYKVVIPGK